MWDDKKNNGISKRWNLTSPPLVFARNHNMGNMMGKENWRNKWMGNMVMGKCQDQQKKSCIAQTNCKHFQGKYGRL